MKRDPKNKRRGSRKALTSHLTTQFAKLSSTEIAEVIRQLLETQLITESNKALNYHF